MKRSRLSRGLQMQYLDLVVQLVLAVPVSVVSAIVIVAVPEAATTVETLAESMTALVGAAISLFGLLMLWRFHRNYRLALILQVVGWLVSMVELAALPLPILIVLGLSVPLPVFCTMSGLSAQPISFCVRRETRRLPSVENGF